MDNKELQESTWLLVKELKRIREVQIFKSKDLLSIFLESLFKELGIVDFYKYVPPEEDDEKVFTGREIKGAITKSVGAMHLETRRRCVDEFEEIIKSL